MAFINLILDDLVALFNLIPTAKNNIPGDHKLVRILLAQFTHSHTCGSDALTKHIVDRVWEEDEVAS